jgi:hypothetical protein
MGDYAPEPAGTLIRGLETVASLFVLNYSVSEWSPSHYLSSFFYHREPDALS